MISYHHFILALFLFCIISNSRYCSKISYLFTQCGLGILMATTLKFHSDIRYNKTVADMSLTSWWLVQPFWYNAWVWRIDKALQWLSSSWLWDGRLFGHNRYGSKIGVCPVGGGAGPPSSTMRPAKAYLQTKWHLDPSSQMATIDMGRKVGAVPFLGWGS